MICLPTTCEVSAVNLTAAAAAVVGVYENISDTSYRSVELCDLFVPLY